MAKKKKFSLQERIHFCNKKRMNTRSKTVAARCEGYLDVVTSKKIDSSNFATKKEKDAYYKGVDKGQKVFAKLINVKF